MEPEGLGLLAPARAPSAVEGPCWGCLAGTGGPLHLDR
jgi:hypothetical protein